MVTHDSATIFNNLSNFIPNLNSNVKRILKVNSLLPQDDSSADGAISGTSPVPSIEIIPPSPGTPERKRSFIQLFEINKKVLTETLDIWKLKLRRFSEPSMTASYLNTSPSKQSVRRMSMPATSGQFLLKVPTQGKKRRRRHSLPVMNYQSTTTFNRLVKAMSDENIESFEEVEHIHDSKGEARTVHNIYISGYGKKSSQSVDDTVHQNAEQVPGKRDTRLRYTFKWRDPDTTRSNSVDTEKHQKRKERKADNLSGKENALDDRLKYKWHDLDIPHSKSASHYDTDSAYHNNEFSHIGKSISISTSFDDPPSFDDIVSMPTAKSFQQKHPAANSSNNKSSIEQTYDVTFDNRPSNKRNDTHHIYNKNNLFMNSKARVQQPICQTYSGKELTYRGNSNKNGGDNIHDNFDLSTAERHRVLLMGDEFCRKNKGSHQKVVMNKNTSKEKTDNTSSITNNNSNNNNDNNNVPSRIEANCEYNIFEDIAVHNYCQKNHKQNQTYQNKEIIHIKINQNTLSHFADFYSFLCCNRKFNINSVKDKKLRSRTATCNYPTAITTKTTTAADLRNVHSQNQRVSYSLLARGRGCYACYETPCQTDCERYYILIATDRLSVVNYPLCGLVSTKTFINNRTKESLNNSRGNKETMRTISSNPEDVEAKISDTSIDNSCGDVIVSVEADEHNSEATPELHNNSINNSRSNSNEDPTACATDVVLTDDQKSVLHPTSPSLHTPSPMMSPTKTLSNVLTILPDVLSAKTNTEFIYSLQQVATTASSSKDLLPSKVSYNVRTDGINVLTEKRSPVCTTELSEQTAEDLTSSVNQHRDSIRDGTTIVKTDVCKKDSIDSIPEVNEDELETSVSLTKANSLTRLDSADRGDKLKIPSGQRAVSLHEESVNDPQLLERLSSCGGKNSVMPGQEKPTSASMEELDNPNGTRTTLNKFNRQFANAMMRKAVSLYELQNEKFKENVAKFEQKFLSTEVLSVRDGEDDTDEFFPRISMEDCSSCASCRSRSSSYHSLLYDIDTANRYPIYQPTVCDYIEDQAGLNDTTQASDVDQNLESVDIPDDTAKSESTLDMENSKNKVVVLKASKIMKQGQAAFGNFKEKWRRAKAKV